MLQCPWCRRRFEDAAVYSMLGHLCEVHGLDHAQFMCPFCDDKVCDCIDMEARAAHLHQCPKYKLAVLAGGLR